MPKASHRGIGPRRLAGSVCGIALAVGIVTSAQAQSTRPPSASPVASPESRATAAPVPPDIIVRGVPDGPYPVKVAPQSGTSADPIVTREAAADARLFARCVTPTDGAALRDLMDGMPNGALRAAALSHLVADHMGCYPGFVPVPMGNSNWYGECHLRGTFVPVTDPLKGVVAAQPVHTICQSFYDRGAVVEKILELYAPDLGFTTAQLMAPAVLARFHAREDRFDTRRSKPERVYAAVAACLVAVHPELALQYPRSRVNGAAEAQLRNALIGTAPQCVGGAKKVSIDPAQFRVFLADAIYSWAAALRDTNSLLPENASGS